MATAQMPQSRTKEAAELFDQPMHNMDSPGASRDEFESVLIGFSSLETSLDSAVPMGLPVNLLQQPQSPSLKRPANGRCSSSGASSSSSRLQNPYAKRPRHRPFPLITSPSREASKETNSLRKLPIFSTPSVSGTKFPQAGLSTPPTQSGTYSSTFESLSTNPEKLPSGLSATDRFFAALLRSPVADYIAAAKTTEGMAPLSPAILQWNLLCQRVGLKMPTQKIRPIYDTAAAHYGIRAALVLEEARHALSTTLAERHAPRLPPAGHPDETRSGTISIPVQVRQQIGLKSTGIFLTFQSSDPFKRNQRVWLRSGVVVECHRPSQSTILARVLPSSKDRIITERSFDVEIYDRSVKLSDFRGEHWNVVPVDFFVSESRQFEALIEVATSPSENGRRNCSTKPPCVPFLHALLGHGNPSVERSATPATTGIQMQKKKVYTANAVISRKSISPISIFRLSSLNKAQEEIVANFISSPPNSISIVQGPPGTGKTTLLVSTIAQYLSRQSGSRKRLMVCAPTNKAIALLATRVFTKASLMNEDTPPYRMLMVGDEEKLLEEPPGSNQDHVLKEIYLYSWKAMMVKGFDGIRQRLRDLSTMGVAFLGLSKTAKQLKSRIISSLRALPKDLITAMDELCSILHNLQTVSESDRETNFSVAEKLATGICQALRKLDDSTVVSELLASADVIFCTLCTAGADVIQRNVALEALIVDEAAAATEPCLYIPFRLKPSRVMIVGDPKQLPAVVQSKTAKWFGLDISLHERLMYQCGHPYTMLDIQYRMHPEISHFPMLRFYEGKVSDSDSVVSRIHSRYSRLPYARPYVFHQIAGQEEKTKSGSLQNREEAEQVVHILSRYENPKKQNWCSPDSIRVITFYRSQVETIKRLIKHTSLKDVLVSTVDSSQGCEADVVIVSFVRSGGPAGFLNDNRRLNVALTRARRNLICVGNVKHFGSWCHPREESLYLLSTDAYMKQRVLVHR